jgi:hypothetical protein
MQKKMSDKKNLINNIKTIESELDSFDKEKSESALLVEGEKRKFINELKSGSFDEMLNEIQNRNTKKETFFQKLFKLF